MRTIFFVIFILAVIHTSIGAEHPEIYCKHFYKGYPLGTAASNDLIIRDNYALSNNDKTKFADWVAYKLDKSLFTGKTQDRNWKADPWLSDDETLEPDDYRDVYAQIKFDRGHQAPLASFKGSESCWETNYLSNITPQKIDLNRGPWKVLEELERKLLDTFETAIVMTGPLYEKEMPKLPNADEEHVIPSGYWKIVVIPITPKKFECVGFIFDQVVYYNEKMIEHVVSIDEIEKRSGLDFFWELEDKIENQIEKELNKKIAEKFFKN